jgi:HD-GYP domain-containing protein (c-di-GMP phosphodiesterase class II)
MITRLENAPLLVMIEYQYTRNGSSPLATGKSAGKRYAELANMLQRILRDSFIGDPASEARQLPLSSLFSISEMVVLSLVKYREVLDFVVAPRYTAGYIACHSLNVAFLSCAIGLEIDLRLPELAELGVAALLHDIGMLRMEDDTCLTEKELTAGQRSLIKMHPLFGRKFFTDAADDVPFWLVRAVSEEHERDQGSGYPEGIRGTMHHYAAIIGICDTLEALTHERVYRNPVSMDEALQTITQDTGLFARDLREALKRAVGKLSAKVKNESAES